MARRRFMNRRMLIEVFEEITSSRNWIVPEGCTSVDVFVVAGGENGERGSRYAAGNGGNGGGCRTFRNIIVTAGTSIYVKIGGINEPSYFMNSNYQANPGEGGKGGTNHQSDGYPPTPGKPGSEGSYAFGEKTSKFPNRYGAGGGAGAYIRGLNQGYISGGAGGETGGGTGAGVNDSNGNIDGVRGGNASFYGAGGGGASKASGGNSSTASGGTGYQGIVILHYYKYRS